MLTTAPLQASPQNIEAEHAVLGGILLDREAIARIKDLLPPEAFSLEAHRKIYKAAIALDNQGNPTDLMSVATWLSDRKLLDKVGGTVKLAQLVDRTVSAVNIDRYATLLIDKHLRRELIRTAREIEDLGHDGYTDLSQVLQRTEELTLALTQSPLRDNQNPRRWQYDKLIQSIRDIELKIDDPGYRTWELQELAGKYKRTPRQLEDIYFKSLISEENEPAITLDELIAKYGSEIREWLMHGFLPKGTTILLHANGGIGKTRLSYDLFYHLATGTDWDGFNVTAPQRRCMIVQTDESANDMIGALVDRGFDSSFPIRYKTRWTVDHIQQLRAEIEAYKPEVILIDSLTTVSRNATFTENDTEYARPLLLLRDIAQEFGCTILIVHHSNKLGESRGSGAIFNSVSEVWKLSRDPQQQSVENTERLLTIEKSRSRCPGTYRLKFNPEDKSWNCLGKEGEEEHSPGNTLKDAIVRFLALHPGVACEATEIHHHIGGSLEYVRLSAYQLAEEGRVSRKRLDRKGKPYAYFLTFDGDRQGRGDHERSPSTIATGLSLVEGSSLSARCDLQNSIFPNDAIAENVKNDDRDDHHFETKIETVTETGLQTEEMVIVDSDRPDRDDSIDAEEDCWNIGDRVVTSFGVEGEVTAAGNKYIRVRWSNKKQGSYEVAKLEQEGITKIFSMEPEVKEATLKYRDYNDSDSVEPENLAGRQAIAYPQKEKPSGEGMIIKDLGDGCVQISLDKVVGKVRCDRGNWGLKLPLQESLELPLKDGRFTHALNQASIEELKQAIQLIDPKGNKKRLEVLQKRLAEAEEIEALPPIENEWRGYRAVFKKTLTGIVARVFKPSGESSEVPAYVSPMKFNSWLRAFVDQDLEGGTANA